MLSMAIKYIVIPDKRMVTAILSNTRFDAYNKAIKMCRLLKSDQTSIGIYPEPEQFIMPNEFKVTVKCDENDVFDENIGKEKARERLLRNYYKSFDKKINKFMDDLYVIYINQHCVTEQRSEFIRNKKK